MGAACTTAGSSAPPPMRMPNRSHYPPTTNYAANRPKSVGRTVTTRPVSRLPTHSNPTPVLLDADTHSIKSLSTSQFQISDIAGTLVPSRSPTRRPTIVPNGNRVSTRSRLEKPIEIQFKDLVFKQSLGQGTYGEVSRGYWKGRKVAIKKIFPGATSQERMEVLADFDKEMAILSKLRHPRIVQFLGAVNEQDQPLCLVFELCEGSVALLLKMVRRGQIQLTWKICLGILRDAAEAIHSLHSQTPKIIHRDIKAENLLLESDFHCKLTDFGLSRPFDARRPLQMTVCGTPCWVAPEIFRSEAYDEKVDVYSFGVLIWEILAAKKPYGDRDCADLPVLVGSKGLRPGPLSHVPKEVNELMVACWEETPARRPDFDKVRKWLDHIAYVVDFNRKMGFAVHVTHYAANCWQNPPLSFEFKPPVQASPIRDSKRFSAHRIKRQDGNAENRMQRQNSQNDHNNSNFVELALI